VSDPIVILIGPGQALDGDFTVRVSASHVEEVTEALQDSGFEPDGVLEHSETTAKFEALLVAFAKAGDLDALASVLATIFARHQEKRFVVRGPGNIEIWADGYSATEVRKMLGAAKELVDQQDAVRRRQVEAGELTSNREFRSANDADDGSDADA